MAASRIRAGAVLAAATISGATGLTTAVTAQAAKPAARTSIVGQFRGSIRTGTLADLSLDGALALTADGSGAIHGVLVDGDGAGHTYVLAHVTGQVGAHVTKLAFHTPSGHVVSGTTT